MIIEEQQTSTLKQLFDYVLNLETPDNTFYFFLSIFLIVILTIGREVFIYRKSGVEKINSSSVTLKIILSIAVGYILLLIVRTPVLMIFAVLASTPVSEFLYNRYFKDFLRDETTPESNDEMILAGESNIGGIEDISESNSDIPASIDEIYDSESLSTEPENEVSNNPDVNFDAIKNPDLSNIMDLLVLYNYVSPNQLRRLYEENLLITSADTDVEQFLEMTVLTKEELSEIKAIKNLIKLEGRLVTKEEATKWLISVKNKQLQKNPTPVRRVRKVNSRK